MPLLLPSQAAPSHQLPIASVLTTGLFGSLAWYLSFLGVVLAASAGLWFDWPFSLALPLGAILGWGMGAWAEAAQIHEVMVRQDNKSLPAREQ